MSEFQDILDGLRELARTGQAGILATLLRVQGSAFRQPGAQILLLSDGRRLGTITAGCLENELFQQAQTLAAGEKARVLVFNTLDDREALWGYGLGCQGILTVLLERVDAPLAGFLAECMDTHGRGVLATVYGDRNGAQIASRLMVTHEKTLDHGHWPASRRAEAQAVAQQTLTTGRSRCAPVADVDVFFHVLKPATRLLCFGAGEHVLPLVRLAKTVGWQVSVCDPRPELASHQRFPQADEILNLAPADLEPALRARDCSAAVVLTHRYQEDLLILQTLMRTDIAYIGLLSSRRRASRLLEDLRKISPAIDPRRFARLYAPVGLDIGGETPEEIALSIVAEIQASLAGRAGGMLRDQLGGIHGAAQA